MTGKRQIKKKKKFFFCLYFGCRIEGGAMSSRDVRCFSDDEKIFARFFFLLFFSSDTKIHPSFSSHVFVHHHHQFLSSSFFHVFFSLIDIPSMTTKTGIRSNKQGHGLGISSISALSIKLIKSAQMQNIWLFKPFPFPLSKTDLESGTCKSHEIWRICWDYSGKAMIKFSAL